VILFAGGLRQLRELRSGSNYFDQNDLAAHFGLGKTGTIDKVIVRWPNGLVESFPPPNADQYVPLVEGEGIPLGEQTGWISQ